MKNILVCVSGLTPQIITESLFCLAIKEKTPIHEIYVITTARGREVILGLDKAVSTPKIALKTEIESLCSKYKISVPLFINNSDHIIVAKEESIELSDVRSDKQNKLFPNKVAEFIRLKSLEKETVLYCVISGGRKSMSVHLAFALSLFGRENDRLLHVLTSEENEFKGFYPLNKKEALALELSEIPFVRLRSLIVSSDASEKILNKKFSDIVELTQKQLKKLSDRKQLFIDVENRSLYYDGNSIQLEPLEFAIYFLFIEHNLTLSAKPITINHIHSAEFGSHLLEFIREKYNYYFVDEKKQLAWTKIGFDPEVFRSKRTKINSKLSTIIMDSDIFNEFKIDSIKNYRDTAYLVKAAKSKFKINY
ncbi:MAG: family CRISPR-associated protein [Ignavibacteria bacterium]|nr:MAG: family CRISPR-associated protein [Ignavibacteria bacterium]KAF0158118.1 MAG: family CRISPR-associated protein [Ignavibacteria bacterium]